MHLLLKCTHLEQVQNPAVSPSCIPCYPGASWGGGDGGCRVLWQKETTEIRTFTSYTCLCVLKRVVGSHPLRFHYLAFPKHFFRKQKCFFYYPHFSAVLFMVLLFCKDCLFMALVERDHLLGLQNAKYTDNNPIQILL